MKYSQIELKRKLGLSTKRTTARLKRLRKKAHELGEMVWGSWNSVWGLDNRRRMYYWMGENTSTGHIGTLSEEELERIIKKMYQLL